MAEHRSRTKNSRHIRFFAKKNDRNTRIFISYRRAGTAGYAQLIADNLVKSYGPDLIFMDVDSIKLAENFKEKIFNALSVAEVMLAIIGPGWLSEEDGRRRIDDPHDYVRQEIATAIERHIPIIPVLVDGAQFPASEDLPEEIRLLAQMQGQVIKFDSHKGNISSILRGVELYVKRRRSFLALGVMLAVAVVLALAVALAVVGVMLWAHFSDRGQVAGPASSSAPAALSASAAVIGVRSPDRLAVRLLYTPFTAADMPSDTQPGVTKLSAGYSGLYVPGLDEYLEIRFNDTAVDAQEIKISYFVFASQSAASTYWHEFPPYLPGYEASGSSFEVSGIADPMKCLSAQNIHQPQQSAWYCVTLSGDVLSYSDVIEGGSGDGANLESELAGDAVQHLLDAAATVPSPSVSPPDPGSSSPDANELSTMLASSFPVTFTPSGLTYEPGVDQVPLAASASGLIGSGGTREEFAGSGAEYDSARIYFYVFGNTKDAYSWLESDPPPDNPAGQPAELVSGKLIPSGLPSPQHAVCGIYTQPAMDNVPAEAKAVCYLQWGDVVITSVAEMDATPNGSAPSTADANMSYTAARAGLLRVSQVSSS
jgi:hypothetical protein